MNGNSNLAHLRLLESLMLNRVLSQESRIVCHWMLTRLSVLDNGKVKHYKLKKLENGHHFVSRSRTFQTLSELVEHYSRQADGLCVRLGEPCKKVKYPVQYNRN